MITSKIIFIYIPISVHKHLKFFSLSRYHYSIKTTRAHENIMTEVKINRVSLHAGTENTHASRQYLFFEQDKFVLRLQFAYVNPEEAVRRDTMYVAIRQLDKVL